MLNRRDGALFLLAALPRLAYLLIVRPPFAGPYWLLSEELLRRGSLGFSGVRTTDFEPVYPMLLAAARGVARHNVLGVQLIQIAVSSAGALLIYRLGQALTGSARIASLGAVLYAGDLLLIKQSVGQSPFVLVTTLMLAFAYLFVTAATTTRAIGAGLMLGLLVVARTMTAPLVGAVAVILAGQGRPRAAAAATVAALALILPWSARNYTLNESWWPTRSGLNLFIGSLPVAATLVPDHDIDLLEPLADAVIAEDLRRPIDDSPESMREIDRVLTRRAISNVSRDPQRALAGRAWNLVHYFWPPLVPRYLEGPDTRAVEDADGGVVVVNAVSRPRVEVVAYSASYTVVLVAAIAGAVARRRFLLRRDAILTCILVTFALTHAVYFPATRYRAPVMFILVLYAAVAFDRVWDRRCRSHSAAAPIPA